MARYEWNSKYILKTPNSNDALVLDDVKNYLKVDDEEDNDLITSLIKAATLIFEKYTGVDVLNKTYTMYLDFFPFARRYGNRPEENFNRLTILVKKSKLQEINSIKYFINSVLTELDSASYSFSISNLYSRIYLIDENDIWPTVDSRKQAVEIEIEAGYGETGATLPEDMKLMLKRIIAYLYKNRGDCNVSDEIDLTTIVPSIDLYKIWEI